MAADQPRLSERKMSNLQGVARQRRPGNVAVSRRARRRLGFGFFFSMGTILGIVSPQL